MNITIHRPKLNELEKLQEFFTLIINDTFQKEGAGHLKEYIDGEITEKMIYIKADINSNGAERYYLIAKDEDQIIGTVGYGPAGTSITENCSEDISSLPEIGTVYVHPDYQGKGIGTMLMKTIHKELLSKGIHKVVLDSGYEKAKKHWEYHLGKPILVIKDYWDKGIDHHIWVYNIEKVFLK